MKLNNTLEICVYGENVERFLNLCSFHDIKLSDITNTDNKYYMNLPPEDFFNLKNIVKKSHVKAKIIRKKGILFKVKKQAKRKLFFITPFLCLLLLWMNSHLLWGVRIEGNIAVTNDLIEDFLQEQGIYYGMPLSKIPIYDLKTNLRTKYDEITWVSIYLKGVYLQISLKERDTKEFLSNPIINSENLVAPADGTVESVLVRQGTALVAPGDTVKKGAVLIEGKVPIPAQDGSIKEIRYCKADGDVYLVYPYSFEEIISLDHTEKQYTGKTYEKYIFTWKDKIWEFPFFKVPFAKYDCITTPLNIPVFKLISLPLEIHQAAYRDYVMIRQKYTPEDARKIAEQKLNKIITSLEEKGVQIIEKNVKIKVNSAYLSLIGELTLKERCNTFALLEEIQ